MVVFFNNLSATTVVSAKTVSSKPVVACIEKREELGKGPPKRKIDGIKNPLKVFFGAADMVLDREDVRYPMEADAEIVGTGATTGILSISTSTLRIRIKISFIWCL